MFPAPTWDGKVYRKELITEVFLLYFGHSGDYQQASTREAVIFIY